MVKTLNFSNDHHLGWAIFIRPQLVLPCLMDNYIVSHNQAIKAINSVDKSWILLSMESSSDDIYLDSRTSMSCSPNEMWLGSGYGYSEVYKFLTKAKGDILGYAARWFPSDNWFTRLFSCFYVLNSVFVFLYKKKNLDELRIAQFFVKNYLTNNIFF